MKTMKRTYPGMRGIYSVMVLLLLFTGAAWAQTTATANAEPYLAPWTGIWRIVDDHTIVAAAEQEPETLVELRLTEDGKGLAVSRSAAGPAAGQEEIKELVIPDGVRRTISSELCSGWQSSQWMPQSGIIIGSSEIQCADAEPYTLANLRMILDTDHMVDVLSVTSSGQTRVAIQRLRLVRELDPEAGLMTRRMLMAARTAISAPWNLDTIIELSKNVDTTALEAALVEKNAHVRLDIKSLRKMADAGMPDQIIDLVVALSFPDRFIIQENGQVAMRTLPPARAGYEGYPVPDIYHYYPGSYWDYRYPFGFYGYYPSAWSYSSPFWWGYPLYGGTIVLPPATRPPATPPEVDANSRLSSSRGYVQITPRDTDRSAVSRDAQGRVITTGTVGATGRYFPSGQSSSGAAQPAASVTPSSGGVSSSGSSSSGSAPSNPGASPSGYSSGSSGDGQAVPR